MSIGPRGWEAFQRRPELLRRTALTAGLIARMASARLWRRRARSLSGWLGRRVGEFQGESARSTNSASDRLQARHELENGVLYGEHLTSLSDIPESP